MHTRSVIVLRVLKFNLQVTCVVRKMRIVKREEVEEVDNLQV